MKNEQVVRRVEGETRNERIRGGTCGGLSKTKDEREKPATE